MIELQSDAEDPKVAGAAVRERLDAAGLTDARIAAVRKNDDHHGPYPPEERTFDADGEPLRGG